MKNKYLLMVVFVLLVGVYVSSQNKKETTFFSKENSITLLDPDKEEVKEINLEEYVLGVVAAEMPASFNDEALKAQAVAARTYAVYKMQHTNKEYDVIADISNQAYITDIEMKDKWQKDFDKYYNKVKKAVNDTKDIVMYYDDNVIISYYFAMSNGKTENVAQVFGENQAYLVSVDSNWDKNVKNFEVTNTFSKEDFCLKLDLACNNLVINNINRSDTGRVNEIVINNKTFKGTDFRFKLGLRSTDFDINITDLVTITTRGYGHGVGMSQYGANEMAKLGFSYEDILKYYYKDITLNKVSV